MNDDHKIIQAILKGDTQAFSLLYESQVLNVYNTALSYVKNTEEAEEITQDVFVKIQKSIHAFNGNSALSTWIYRITVNTSLDYVKKKKRFTLFRSTLKADESTDFEHPGVLLENKENAAALYKAMDCLPDHQKTAFILSYIEELPRQEVAEIMETSLKAVESLLQRAKKNMRSELIKLYPHRRKSK